MSFPGSCGLLQGSTPFTASSTFASTAGTMIPASDTLRTGAPPRPGIPRGIVCTARVGPLDHTEAGLVAHGSRSWTECRDRPPRAVGARIDGRDGCRWATRIPRSLAPLSRSGATLTEPGRCRPGCTVQGPGTEPVCIQPIGPSPPRRPGDGESSRLPRPRPRLRLRNRWWLQTSGSMLPRSRIVSTTSATKSISSRLHACSARAIRTAPVPSGAKRGPLRFPTCRSRCGSVRRPGRLASQGEVRCGVEPTGVAGERPS